MITAGALGKNHKYSEEEESQDEEYEAPDGDHKC